MSVWTFQTDVTLSILQPRTAQSHKKANFGFTGIMSEPQLNNLSYTVFDWRHLGECVINHDIREQTSFAIGLLFR